MTRFVIEHAVAVKWFVPEEFSSPAARLLDGGHELLAPDTIFTEVTGILTAKVRLDELSHDEGGQIVEAFRSVPLQIHSTSYLLKPAMQIAEGLDVPFRDALGMAVALQTNCRLVTANRTFYNRVQGTAFAAHVKWVGDLR